MLTALLLFAQIGHRIDVAPGAAMLTAAAVVQEATLDIAFNAPKYPLYIFVPEKYEPSHAYAGTSLVWNSTGSRTSNLVLPEKVSDRLIRIDIDRSVSRDGDIPELVSVVDQFADRDTFFRVPKATIDAIKVKLTDGQWADAKFVRSISKDTCEIEYGGKRITVRTADTNIKADVFVEGYEELIALTGRRAPLLHYEEFIAFGFSTVNKGLYAPLSGITGDLRTVVERFAGKDAADKLQNITADLRRGRLDPALSNSRALVVQSGVTDRQRLVQVFFGANGQPHIGPQVIAVTFDVAEDQISPDEDPLRNLRAFKNYAGGEMVFSLPNGLLGYAVFDAKDKIIESVPDKVAFDFHAKKVRANIATARVFSGVSCMACHSAAPTNYGWQPVRNDALDLLRLLSPIDDKTTKDRRRALQEIASQYGARDLETVFNFSRLAYEKQSHAATGIRLSKEVAAAVADVYFGYYADRITPRIAALDLGVSLSDADAQAYLLKIPPALGVEEITEDAVLARLKDGLHVVPSQWRSVRALVRERIAHGEAK